MKKDKQKLIDALSSGPVRQFLTDHEHSDLRRVILKNKEILGIPTSQLFEQIALRKKAREKLPLYYNTPNIVYPPQENFEQTSSETTAVFKSHIVAGLTGRDPSVGVDLTGGFGVDAYFLSRTFEDFHCVEPNQSLCELAKYNHQLLGATNIHYHNTTAEDFLETTGGPFGFVYIDPSRRNSGGKRTATFAASQPDIIKLASSIFSRSRWLLVKASPLMDLQAGISQLFFTKTVYVLSVNNECKEVLFLCEKNSQDTPRIEAINLSPDGLSESFVFTFPEERELLIELSDPLQFLYEPNASILKSGAFKTIAARYGLKKLHSNTHLYTSGRPVDDFPGRRFCIESIVRPDAREVKKYLPEGHANVMTRNYPLSAEQLKQKVRLKDGGEKFLIGFSGINKKYVVVASKC